MLLRISILVILVFPSFCDRYWKYRHEQYLHEGRAHVLRTYRFTEQKYYTGCGFWRLWSCTRYRQHYQYRLYCENGWSNDGTLPDCRYAMCDGKIKDAACNKEYHRDVIIRHDKRERHSGGHCTSPNKCTDCNNGFYSDGPYCQICPKIEHCNHRICTYIHDNQCEWCEGEILPKPFWRAYTPYPSLTKKLCKKACSWRSDSRRCYPGTCAEELESQCTCWNGFGGHHCSDIVIDVDVKYAEAKLTDANDKILTTPVDPNEPGPQPIRWTNNVAWRTAEIEFKSKFPALGDPPPLDPKGETHFVTDFKFGIISATMTLTHERGVNQSSQVKGFSCYSNENTPLPDTHCARKKMKKDTSEEMRKGTREVDISAWQFRHDHKLIFKWRITNGGYLIYIDRESWKTDKAIRVSLNGRILSRSYTFQWDLIDPYHECVITNSKCADPPVKTTDVTEMANVSVSWVGWKDDLADIDHYEYDVFELTTDGIQLTQESKNVLSKKNISTATQYDVITIPSPGMYSVIVVVYDKAGNFKSTRCLIFYDNQSKVDSRPDMRTIVTQTSKATNYTWVSVTDKMLKVSWKDLFINERHKKHSWLSAVASLQKVDNVYDDHFGKRDVMEIPNAHGIVRFEIRYMVLAPTTADQQPFTQTKNVLEQSGTIDVTWDDGNRLDITVRAFDIFEKFAEDTITVFKDTSPPRIDNLWLSRGDRMNISVHNIDDFTKMTIEWEAIDYDSGLAQVKWRLFDNYNYTGIDHGKAELRAQGMAENLTECEEKYQYEPRGPSCYCTMFHGCYHKHFYVKPKIVKDAGLTPGKDQGVHDSDYYIEVTVINNALLETTFLKKITIDVSAPHEGAVHDGIRGEPEVDYQQDLHIDVHWEGFFDRESGVEFYQYIFSDHCFSDEEFKNSTKAKETYNTFASYDAPGMGTYVVSVVAVNRAKENSNVVCSDGVTVTTTIPYVTNFVLEGARTKPRLVKDSNGTIWYFDNTLKRYSMENSSMTCSSVSTMTNITIFPVGKSLPTLKPRICDGTINLHILAVVSKSSQFKMSWSSAVDRKLIHDFEVGLSSTSNGIAPDIFPFRSSKHHSHFRLNHPDVPDEREFYVVIKSIGKSGINGLQSIGPFIVDTTKPRYSSGKIDVRLENKFLVADWSNGAFTDPDDPYPMQFQYAIGHKEHRYDIQSFHELQYGGTCKRTTRATCTALPISQLKLSLHGRHTYYFTIKATNLAGLSTTQTSVGYRHDIQLAAKGIIHDVHPTQTTGKRPKDIEDIDFITSKTSLAISWSGFLHPHQTVLFRACVGTTPKACDTSPMETLHSTDERHVFHSLNLQSFQIYYCTLEASTTAGNVTVSSDGIRVLDISKNLPGIIVRDGTNCSGHHGMKHSHHQQDTRPKCSVDSDYQTSTTTMHAYWDIPNIYNSYLQESFVKIEERLVDDTWISYRDFFYVGRHRYTTISNLDLKPGISYRTVVKLCADDLCFPFVYGNGITVLFNPPAGGEIKVDLQNRTNSKQQLSVTFKKMKDPDVKDATEAMDVVSVYEWALGDNVGIHTDWNIIENFTTVDNKHMQFIIQFNSSFDFSKCRKLYIRGYNKAGVWATVSTEIRKCNNNDGDSLIVANMVIDAIGRQEYSLDGTKIDGYGHDIILAQNERWEKPDVDYTPYKNILSATWPLLRHKNYSWAVIDAENIDVTSYYKDEARLQLTDPCSHPDAINCGQTEKEYINVIFNTKQELEHGKRYIVCTHAPRKEIMFEKWTEVLDEVKTCSDGVTVDLTPPTSGHVWIGIDPTVKYQSSSSDIFVSWESFTDVEEYKQTVHKSGIKEYQVGVGSTKGGTDIAAYTNVGIVNHYTFHGLRLQNGHEYYATVRAFDFSTRSSTADSHPVKIDNTPPEKSERSIKIDGRHLSNLSEINACWRDVFLDQESGIDHYLWAIGSHPGHDDLIPFTKTTVDCGVSAEDKNIDIHEGHAYFITVKAINRAKLVATASSWAYIFDMSPPISGHVYDGSPEQTLSYMKDLDYQTDIRTLSSFWEGFHDPHSTIKTYYVSVGTCPDCEDVLTNQDIGITNNFTLCHIHLGSGIRYYTTITACNTADLCTSVTSDGVVIDNSPPTQGTVQDGVDVYDVEYQSLRNYISSKWYGFTDPQSGIDKLSWRVGTKPGSDDILKSASLPISDIVVEPNLLHKLPTGKRIYVTIKAYNKAGLSTEATSNGFYIDETPPSIKVKPQLSRDLGSIKEDSIVFRSTIKVTWEVEDKESFIQRQYLSIASHKGEDFNATSTELNGIVREYTFPRLDLHDGGNYTIKLIVCNGAKICVEDEARGFIVDSSPPTPGMFAIKTDHAANLHRHIYGWMTWSRYKLWLSWLGFTDMHTGIDKYYVSLGSQYMMDDLNKISGSPQEFLHSESGIDKEDEGFVQTFEVYTNKLANLEHVFVSVWAVNGVGLSSRMIHSQFRLVPGGSLELIRRCTAVTCLGHCVCAAQGKRCSLNGNKCNDITKANANNLLGVYDITNVQPTSAFSDVEYSPSNVAIATKWHVVQAQGLRPIWYEWSAGLTKLDEPEGIFEDPDDHVWHHAGQTKQAVYNLKRGKILKELPISYSMFVRAWYNVDAYADFKTNGLLVLSTPLAKRKIKGAAVVEQIPGHWKKDVDYIKPGSHFTIRWTNVFIGHSDMMDKFKVYISTYPGGHDVHVVDIDLPGTMTSYNISRVPLTPGILFYSNVVGYSLSGIHSTETSDGIMVDTVPPTFGMVFDGIGIHDIDYQNSSDTVGASWHGFSDRDSGITHYMWCVQTQSSNQPCGVRDWENVGIHRSVSRQLNTSNLSTGTEIESLVFGVDLIGHQSKTVKSNGIIIDTTHPEPTLMEHLEENIAINPSFEETNGDTIDWNNVTDVNFCTNIDSVQPLKWNSTTGSCVAVLKSDKNVAMDGRSFLFVEGEISQTLEKMASGQLYRVTFLTAHPPILGAVLANKEGYVQISDERHVFMVYTKNDKHGSSTKEVDWHHHTFYFRSNINKASISLGSMTGNTGILFDDIKVQQAILHVHDDSEAQGKHIHAHVVALHQWSSIHASWSFVDPESPIIDYMWAIGYTEGSTEIQGFTSVGLSNFAYNYNVSLAHTSIIHITVIATNAAGLMREAHAEDLLVDLTPPEVLFVNDGIGSDIDAQTTDEISANWDVNDHESGLEVCEWAVGYQQYGNEIQAFQKLRLERKLISKIFPTDQISMQMVHVTLRCRNKAGLQSTLSSNGVKISNLPPQTTSAEVEILPHSMTEYNCRDHYQGDITKLRVKWTGFTDMAGLDSYMLTLQNHDKSVVISKSVLAENQDTSYCILDGLTMVEGNFTASVKAVNKMYLRSTPVTSDISVSPMLPRLTENPNLKLTIDTRTIMASWKDHFSTQQPIYYEVSAGTTLGGADIIQWQETQNSFLEFELPLKIKSIKDLIGYISVRAISANGMDFVLNAAVKL